MEISRIRLIDSDVSVWLIYAGKGRRFFDLFRNSNSVFLNLPGFDASDQVFQSEELMRRHLAMSDQIARWIRGGRSSPPERRASTYSPYPHAGGTPDAKAFGAELGNIQRLFVQAKTGDLVLSPPYGHYEPYLIGEITHAWKKEDDLIVPTLSDEAVPARKVRWLNAALARRDFPPRISKRLQNQHAITQVDEDFYLDIFGLIYPHYVWKNISKIDIFGPDYSGTDPTQTYHAAILTKYILASVFAYNRSDFEHFQSLDPTDAIEAYYDQELINEFGQNFNSPGKFSVIAALGSLSILASAGLYVATADPQQSFETTSSAAKNTVKHAIYGTGKSSQEAVLDDYIDSMKAVNWKEVQKKLGAPATKAMSVSLSNAADVERHRAELDDK